MVGELDERLQTIADDVRVRKLSLVRQGFPGRIEKRRCAQPSFQILLKTFLRLQIFRNDYHRAVWQKFLQQHDEKRL